MPSTTPDWDAETYDRLAEPQEEWARALMDERLPLEGDEDVLDAGCGSGRVTRLLLDRLPNGRVLGVDGSPSMIETAGRNLAEYGERLSLLNTDLLELEPAMVEDALGRPDVDVIFSNATFHWIPDHERLFSRLYAVLRPGGRLAVQFGGTGNVPEWVEAVERATARPEFGEPLGDFWPWHFKGLEETRDKVEAAGFEDIHCWFRETTAEPPEPRNWISVVGLAPHHERLPPDLTEAFTDAVMEELPDPVVFHYVRLNVAARRPDG
jgi:trans-aconitate 2-methyltransferase